jgi:hypothetical protein
MFRLSPGRLLHYSLIVTFYPSMALGWMLGIVNAVLYLALGASGIIVPPSIWFALYTDATAFSLWLYLTNRRYNVSPYEAEGSRGLKGMMMSVIAAPIYAAMLFSTLLRRPARFVVTPKGSSSNRDGLRTFRNHLGWTAVLACALGVSFVRGYASPGALLWPAVAFGICLAPIACWRLDVRRARAFGFADAPAGTRGREHAGDITMEIPKVLQEAIFAESPDGTPDLDRTMALPRFTPPEPRRPGPDERLVPTFLPTPERPQ